MSQPKSCYNCAHLRHEVESWEMQHIWWKECAARPANGMLRQFPFRRTTCKRWTKRERPLSANEFLALPKNLQGSVAPLQT